MIRKIFKWIGIVLGSLVGLIVLALALLFIIGSVKWNRIRSDYDVPVETIIGDLVFAERVGRRERSAGTACGALM